MSWASLYDKSKWSCSIVHLSGFAPQSIYSEIGRIPVQKLQPIHVEMLYNTLRTKKMWRRKGTRRRQGQDSLSFGSFLRHIHTLLKTAFDKSSGLENH